MRNPKIGSNGSLPSNLQKKMGTIVAQSQHIVAALRLIHPRASFMHETTTREAHALVVSNDSINQRFFSVVILS